MIAPAVYRALFGGAVVVLGCFLALSVVAGPVDVVTEDGPVVSDGGPTTNGPDVSDDSVIVMTGQTFGDRPGDALMTFRTGLAENTRSIAPDDLRYYNNSYDEYHDVDPVPGTRMTVLYVAATHLSPSECEATRPCTRNVIERLNMTTDTVTRLHSVIQPREEGNDVHDVDRISKDELLVADTINDRVYVLNTTTKLITWEWDAKSAYPVSGGGPFPTDWTHLNDVEYLPDRGENGWIMVSLRNQDQVVFVDRERGLVENWTLGNEDDYDILYEQHNPDYIPRENGGPAVLVADSQNNRIVEYQRVDGEWKRTWTYRHLDWPRDADRLPNGHTLVVDSNGGRLLEVNENGRPVWSTLVPYDRDAMYDAEIFRTGDESSGGPSAVSINLSAGGSDGLGRSREAAGERAGDPGPVAVILHAVDGLARAVLPSRLRNTLLFVLPVQLTPSELLAGGTLLGVLGVWATAELRWRSEVEITIQSPVRIRRK